MAKNRYISFVFALLCISCSSIRPATSTGGKQSATSNSGSLTFIETISTHPGSPDNKNKPATSEIINNDYNDRSSSAGIENYSSLRFKYAILTNSSVEQMSNEKLLEFIDYWYGTPYRYGGATKDGIDCSAFASLLLSSVYAVHGLPRMARDQYHDSRRVRRNELKEGDLVFFHTLGHKKGVTHVGVYLCNDKFVHASLSGVMISDMSDGYYASHYVGSGRVRE